MSIGANIRTMRTAQGLSQKELAEKAGVTQSMICQIERGSKTPSVPLCMELTVVFGCTISEIIQENEGE